ncbi:MAG: Fe-S cluster protein [Peptococcaceae bacterium BRH_c8a]|nr:MAG: Fe-S cluster protein [Peptococcaceae bacterium BRH_c8a]
MQLNNPLDVYKHLPKTNCRECQEPTCLAFAAAVIQGKKKLAKCPHLNESVLEKASVITNEPISLANQQEQILKQLKKEITAVDFASSTERLGAVLTGEKLAIKILGRDFVVDTGGNITSACHVIHWVTIPLLSYIISSAGKDVAGTWMPFRELKKGTIWLPLYDQRCEKPLKQIADKHTDLFADLLHIFGGKQVGDNSKEEISFVLYPLPKVPILIKYKPKDELDSKLNIFFDRTVEENLNIESLYFICAGMVVMFEKIAVRHGIH